MPNLFILTLDIDETVLNSRTPPSMGFDFNGSETYNDASGWLSLIDDLDKVCQAHGYKLAVKFLTAKNDGGVDDTVDACHQYFYQHLYLRKACGKQFKPPARKSYVVSRHVMGQLRKEMYYNHNYTENHSLPKTGISFENHTLMPPIHVCAGNHVVLEGGQISALSSKALVLEKIREFYEISTEQMLHIDNAHWVARDLRIGIGQSKFNIVQCYELEELKFENKEIRTKVAIDLFGKIRQRVSEQLAKLSRLKIVQGAGKSQVESQDSLTSIESINLCDDIMSQKTQILLAKSFGEYLQAKKQSRQYKQSMIYQGFAGCLIPLMASSRFFHHKIFPDHELSNEQELMETLGQLLMSHEPCSISEILDVVVQIETETLLSEESNLLLSHIRSLLGPVREQQMERVSFS